MNEKLRKLNEDLNSLERFFKKEILESFPIDVGIPTGDRCNLQCIFCTQREGELAKQYKNISFAQFLKFTEPLSFANYIQIQGWGEPLFNPDYEKIFDYVAKHCKGAQISFNTNGVLLNEKWINKLTSNDNVLVNVSLNASSKETYKYLSKKDCFDKVIKNIKLLIKTRTEKQLTSPRVYVSIVGMEQNIHELPELVNLAADLGVDYVVLRDLMILRKEREKDSLHYHRDKTIPALQQAFKNAKKRGIILDTSSFPVNCFLHNNFESVEESKSAERLYYYQEYYPERIPSGTCSFRDCYDPWTSFVIDTFGNVRICCYSDVIMGNLFEQSFSEIWNGDMYRYYRRYINTRNPPNECRVCVKKI
jgi:MoaA/NifB/PqqE/SkfB family radical SAM enzyme